MTKWMYIRFTNIYVERERGERGESEERNREIRQRERESEREAREREREVRARERAKQRASVRERASEAGDKCVCVVRV